MAAEVVDIKSIVDDAGVVEKLNVVKVTFSFDICDVMSFNSGNSVVKLVVTSSETMEYVSVGVVLSTVVNSVNICDPVVNIGPEVVIGFVMLKSLFVELKEPKSVVVSVCKFFSVVFGICVDDFGTESVSVSTLSVLSAPVSAAVKSVDFSDDVLYVGVVNVTACDVVVDGTV